MAEGATEQRESRVVGIKSSPNIGVPDRRGRELINCRSGGGLGRGEGGGGEEGGTGGGGGEDRVENGGGSGRAAVNAEVSQ